MRNVISKFEKSIQRINIIYGLLIPLLVSVLLSSLLWVIRPSYFQSGQLAKSTYIAVTVIVLIIAAIQGSARGHLTKKQNSLIYICYHIGLGLLSLFVVPYPSPFAFMWIVLLIGVDLLFGKRWQIVTAAFYVVVQIASYLHAGNISLENSIVCIAIIAGTIVVALQASKYRQISDDERAVLSSASRATTFERQRLLSLINNMGEAVIATDKRGKVLIYNAAVLNLLDTNRTLEGKSLDAILSLKDSKNKKVKLTSLLEKTPIGVTTTDYIHEFGPHDAINLYINIAPVKLGFREEAESGYIMLMRDITKEKSLEDERDEFISVVSHELRTPVAIAEGNISNAIFVSNREKASKIISTSLAQAHDQVLFLASMINDLATLSRAERTDVALEITPVDPRQLIHAMARDYEAQAATKKLKLTVSAAADVQTINTSELYVHEILQNFVTNSIKYTKTGSVIIHVRSNKMGDAVFSIADTGIGLSKADQKRVFDKFFRSEDYRTRESSGTGLGLYVTAKLAHRLNAQISIESELKKGSTFTVTIPSLPTPKKH